MKGLGHLISEVWNWHKLLELSEYCIGVWGPQKPCISAVQRTAVSSRKYKWEIQISDICGMVFLCVDIDFI